MVQVWEAGDLDNSACIAAVVQFYNCTPVFDCLSLIADNPTTSNFICKYQPKWINHPDFVLPTKVSHSPANHHFFIFNLDNQYVPRDDVGKTDILLLWSFIHLGGIHYHVSTFHKYIVTAVAMANPLCRIVSIFMCILTKPILFCVPTFSLELQRFSRVV